jgi:hypothetical protein
MSRTPGAGPRAATGGADQQQGTESPHPRRRNGDPLDPGTLSHPRKRRSRPPGQLGLGRKWKHSDTAAIHLGLEQGLTNLRRKVGSEGGVGG